MDNEKKGELKDFLRVRHQERFFKPIRCLTNAPGNSQGYGFSTTALRCLLVETIQSYRLGLPSTYKRDLERLKSHKSPPEYDVPEEEWQSGKLAFTGFLRNYPNLFPGVDGAKFFKNIRNGLLHQGQTEDGWKIGVRPETVVWDSVNRIVNRNLFAQNLERAFGDTSRN